jgi:hypothetical protein
MSPSQTQEGVIAERLIALFYLRMCVVAATEGGNVGEVYEFDVPLM